MKKVIRPGTIKTYGGRVVSIYCEIDFKDDCLSITGVIGPTSDGNAVGGCGQIDMEFAHRNQDDNDKRYDTLIQPDDISFAMGWDAEKWLSFLDVWKKWHLNDLHAECEHQEILGWTYKTHEGQHCPVCSYKIGTAWTFREVPQSVLSFLASLPNTDLKPAWV